MAHGISNGHVTDDVSSPDPQRCREPVRSAILATAWILVLIWYRCTAKTNEC